MKCWSGTQSSAQPTSARPGPGPSWDTPPYGRPGLAEPGRAYSQNILIGKLVSSTYSEGGLEGVRPPGFGRPGGAEWILDGGGL